MQRLPGWFKQRSNRLYPVSVPLSSPEYRCSLLTTQQFRRPMYGWFPCMLDVRFLPVACMPCCPRLLTENRS